MVSPRWTLARLVASKKRRSELAHRREFWYNIAHERLDRMSANGNQIVIYQPNETVRLDVRVENETVWLTQKLIVIDAYPGVATLDMLAKRVIGEREAA